VSTDLTAGYPNILTVSFTPEITMPTETAGNSYYELVTSIVKNDRFTLFDSKGIAAF